MSDTNPYAPPQADLNTAPLDSELDHRAALSAFVGPRAEIYLSKWDAMGYGNTSWNWAAFLFGLFWMTYRKMYAYTAMLFGIISVELVIELLLDLPSYVGNVINFAMAIIVGRYANYLYKQHAEKKIREFKASQTLTQENLAQLASKGGTNVWAMLGLVVAFILLFVAIVVVVGVAMAVSGAQ